MAIPFTKYVNITSAVGGNNAIQITELISRIFTENPLIPTGGIPLQFSSAQAVGNYFSTSSVEYLRALFYFTWISKQYNSPENISYARWANVNTAPQIFGAALSTFGTTLATLQAVTTGAFALTMGSVTNQITGLNFSADGSFAAIATSIQTAIRTQTGEQWTAATVTYTATPGAFNLVGGDTSVDAVISVASPASGTDISTMIGWIASAAVYPSAPIYSNGVQAETITETLTNSKNASTNFGSYLFIPVLTEAQIIESATWNLSQNNLYMYLVPAPNQTDALTYATDLINIGGSAITLAPLAAEYPEMVPGIILAATNYNLPNASQNYMFQQNFNLTPSVTDATTAQTLDTAGVNYYGLTQSGGQFPAFYQNGVLTGVSTSTNPTDLNTYANEIWFKNAGSAALGTLLLNATQVSANAAGVALVVGTLQSIIDLATTNGVISVNGFLSASQIGAITAITSDPDAWRQVQTIGYYLDCEIEPYTQGVYPYYRATYTLVYKKNDALRQIVGLDVLI